MRIRLRLLDRRSFWLGLFAALAVGSWVAPTNASALPLIGANLVWDAGELGSGNVDLLSLVQTSCTDAGKTGSCSITSWTPTNGYYTVNDWSSSWDTDPFVTNNFNVTNNSAGTLIFDVTVTSPVVLTGPQTAMSGSIGITLTNTNAGGATLTDAGLEVYGALIDGVVVRTLLDPAYTLTCSPPFCTATDSADFGIFPNPPEIGPQANLNIGIRVRFTLSPGDSAGITSVFNIEAVPEPTPATLIALGLVGISIARRRR